MNKYNKEYRIDQQELLNRISVWDGFLKKKVHLFACGGTALTLLNVKTSTKDIDLVIPDLKEYEYLVKNLKQLGYQSVSGWGWARGDGFIFDLFRGKRVHTTELLESPLIRGNHILMKEFSYIYLGILNYYDIIISKLFRAATVDIEDCLALFKNKRKEIEIKKLKDRFSMTASFDIAEERVNKNFKYFLSILIKEGLICEK